METFAESFRRLADQLDGKKSEFVWDAALGVTEPEPYVGRHRRDVEDPTAHYRHHVLIDNYWRYYATRVSS